jgi:hypothetical protein
MADVLELLEQLNASVEALDKVVQGSTRHLVTRETVYDGAREVTRLYFEEIQPELRELHLSPPLLAQMEALARSLYGLTSEPRRKSAYVTQLAALRSLIGDVMIESMKARGVRLILSDMERGILETLTRMLPETARSYEQVLLDVVGSRVSWRGTAVELREVLREVMDHLAPDTKVMAAPGFRLEPDQKKPTQRQKVRFILKARRSASTVVDTTKETLETFEAGIAALARSTYTRGSISTHTATDGTEVRKLKRYVDLVLVELLEVAV